MRDEGTLVTPGRDPDAHAVKYVLERMRVDADLRYLMLGTEAFACLCSAEAARAGKPEQEIRDHYASSAPHYRDERSRLRAAKVALDEIQTICESFRGGRHSDVVDPILLNIEESIRRARR